MSPALSLPQNFLTEEAGHRGNVPDNTTQPGLGSVPCCANGHKFIQQPVWLAGPRDQSVQVLKPWLLRSPECPGPQPQWLSFQKVGEQKGGKRGEKKIKIKK